jgi:hypothetical protein
MNTAILKVQNATGWTRGMRKFAEIFLDRGTNARLSMGNGSKFDRPERELVNNSVALIVLHK